FRELGAGALYEQQGNMDIPQVLFPRFTRLARRMERKAQERKTMAACQWRDGLRLRGHAAAERFAPGEKRLPRKASRGFRHGGADRGMRDPRRVRPPAGFFHVGKLIAQGRDAAVAKP